MIYRNPRLRKLLRCANAALVENGLNFKVMLLAAAGLCPFLRDYRSLCRQGREGGKRWRIRPTIPCLADRLTNNGDIDRHYFAQDLLVAQKVYRRNPTRHLDVGSRVDGFVAHVAAFRQIEVLDIRPCATEARNIVFRRVDATAENAPDQLSCDSLSCLHALEHFGLGRYGDPINLHGHINGIRFLDSLLRHGGVLYLSVPIGNERIEFNAHRIFAVQTILDAMEGRGYELLSFSYIDDEGRLWEDADVRQFQEKPQKLSYGCGIFEWRKGDQLL